MIAPDQMTLYYSSDRGAADPNAHLYMAKVPFSAATSVALTVLNSTALDYSPYVSADESELYFVSRRPADIDDNIFAARREAGMFIDPVAVAGVNSGSYERSPALSADGLRLYFGSDRAAGTDDFDIYVSARTLRTESFPAAVAVAELNTAALETPDWVAPDDCTMYFRSDRPGGSGGRDIWRARRR
jgi:Tol biopolymer transport system component